MSIKCEEKWFAYAQKYAERAKAEALLQKPLIDNQAKQLERSWHIFSSDESHGLVGVETCDDLETYNASNQLINEPIGSYRAMYLTSSENSSYWGRWMVPVNAAAADSMWSKATECLTNEEFESGSFGLVYETMERKLSLVVNAAQTDQVLSRVGSKLKRVLGVADEIYYEVNGEPLLIV